MKTDFQPPPVMYTLTDEDSASHTESPARSRSIGRRAPDPLFSLRYVLASLMLVTVIAWLGAHGGRL